MKKLLFLLLFFPLFLLAYNPTTQDKFLLDKINIKLEKILKNDSVKWGNILSKLDNLYQTIGLSERLEFFLDKIKSQIIQYRKSTIDSFHYQLQLLKYEKLKNNKSDLLVVDIDDSWLKKWQIMWLKKTGKLVISYISIWEAEDYRDYWKDSWKVGNPFFIDKENPNWEWNYKVLFWEKEWQKIILEKIEKIAKQWYDGVYLDIVDAYYYYKDRQDVNSTQEMIDFVGRIRQKWQAINPNFIIIAQNAVDLYKYKEYQSLVDGFGKEDTWYNGNKPQDLDETKYVLWFLNQALQDGKFILAIDYPRDNSKICDFYKKCKSHWFSCTVMDRDLSIDKARECKNYIINK